MDIVRLVEDARKGYALGKKPVRFKYSNDEGDCCCAIGAAAFANGIDPRVTGPVLTGKWAQHSYGLDIEERCWFAGGFDGTAAYPHSPNLRECRDAGAKLAKEVFG